ncbi:MAG: PepSY domain-containing protein [Patescibacteria group bacterium]
MQEKILMGILLIASLLVGTFFVSAAVTGKNPIDYISSIRVADPGNDNAPEISEAQESAQLASLAKITEEQAKTIALDVVDINSVGELTDVGLDNENGNVVYSVEFTKNGIETDVKIDAGNGDVLKIEGDNDEADKESAETENEKDSDFEQDGVDHEFEGEEEHQD